MTDVLNTFRFRVVLDPIDAAVPRELAGAVLGAALDGFDALGAFQTCSGLGGELEVTSYPEGGRNDYTHQLPVRHSWGRITLTKGISIDPGLFAWYEAGLFGSLGARRDGAIVMFTSLSPLLPAMTWTFTGGLAAKWSGPSFDAEQSGLAIESLEIAHQGIKAVPGASVAGIA